MQIHSKSMKNATSPLFRNHNRSALEAGDVYYASRKLLSTCFYFMIPFIQVWTRVDCHALTGGRTSVISNKQTSRLPSLLTKGYHDSG